MRTTKILACVLMLSLLSCKKQTANEFRDYVFTQPYCATVTVGGVVGVAEKCFNLGDVVKDSK